MSAHLKENKLSRWPAPAKLNLFLRVTGRRPDGYHDIQTLFQLLDWGDEVDIRVTSDKAVRRVQADYEVPESEDLAIRAALLLQSYTDCSSGAEIRVRKNIPMGAGMGGGSSDAATVMLVLNRQWGCGLATGELEALACRLGADVPVFIRGHSALAAGIGDRLRPVILGERYYLLVFPGFSVSTAELFNDPGLHRNSKPLTPEAALAGEGGNDFETVVSKRIPEMKTILTELRRWGSPRMTGTGSGIFIPFDDAQRAKSAAREMKTLYNVRAVRGVDRSPLHVLLDRGGQ